MGGGKGGEICGGKVVVIVLQLEMRRRAYRAASEPTPIDPQQGFTNGPSTRPALVRAPKQHGFRRFYFKI